jgi:hypothetical protein
MRYIELFEEKEEKEDGLYVAAYFDEKTNDKLYDLYKDFDVGIKTPKSSLHCTIVYSKEPVDFESIVYEEEQIATFKEYLLWDTQDGKTLVMVINADYLKQRHSEAEKLGASYDFDEYTPHITLLKELPEDFEISDIKEPDFEIIIRGEFSEPIEN